MLMGLKLLFLKNLKPILWVVLGVMIIGGMYVAITTSIKEGNKASEKAGELKERAVTNEKVIENVEKANENAITPTPAARERRLCEKYDRNRANCQ